MLLRLQRGVATCWLASRETEIFCRAQQQRCCPRRFILVSRTIKNMPNWCYNQLQLFGPEEEIVRFYSENVDAEPLFDVNRRVQQLGEESDGIERCCLSFSKSVPSLVVACDNELCNVGAHQHHSCNLLTNGPKA
jgi:hypothetical protein